MKKTTCKMVVAAIVIIAAMFIGGKVEEPKAPVYDAVEETAVETPATTETEIVEEEKKEVKKAVNKGSNEKIDITRANTENLTSGKTVVEGEEKTNFVAPKATEDSKAIEEAKKDETKKVEELKDGVTAVTEKVEEPKKQPQKEESTKVEITEKVVEVESEEAPTVVENNDFCIEIDFSQFGL